MQTAELFRIIAPVVASLGYEFWGLEYHAHSGRSLLRVYIESEKGITVSDCERVSRQLSALLDVEDLIAGKYDLEVSSPGFDRPLFTLHHYQRYIGQQVRVRTRLPIQDRRNYKGILQAVNAEAITVEGDGQIWVLPLADIEKANLVP